jgi:hypothetical protein
VGIKAAAGQHIAAAAAVDIKAAGVAADTGKF